MEEQRPGAARRQAGKNYIFDDKGRILVTIAFDKTQTIVSRSESVQYQETGQLIAIYGGKVDLGIPLTNEIVAFMPLTRITSLAAEESVVKIYAEEKLPLDPIIVVTVTPTATVDPALAKIDLDLLGFIEAGGQGTSKVQRYVFDDRGRIKVIIIFDQSRILISRSQLLKHQQAGQLIITYDGVVDFGIPLTNAGVAFIPLDRVKDLAKEEAIVRIYPAERIFLDPVIVVTVTSVAP